MDFIVKLPKSTKSNDALLVIVEKLSKMIVTIPLKETTSENPIIVADLFFQHIFLHYEMPDKIISDRDPKFINKFWKNLMTLMGTELAMTTAHRV